MMRSRAPWLAAFALAVLVAEAAPVRADLAGPWPWSRTPPRPIRPLPNPDPPIPPPNMEEPAAPKVAEAPTPPPPPEMWPDDRAVGPRPKRTGPFRSCGSGTPAALAGIGAMWATLWLGNRFARPSRSPSARG